MSETRRRTASFTFSLGAATLFLVIAAAISFIADDGTGIGHGWSLRGTLVPGADAPHRGV